MEILDTAFAQMVKEHKSTIYTVCFMFSKDSDEVSDLFQEVLINLWKGYDSFKNLSNVNTWIWKVSIIRKSKFPWFPERSVQFSGKRTKRSVQKKRLHTTLIKPEQKVNEDLCSGFIVS